MPRIPNVRVRTRNGTLFLDYWYKSRRYGPAIGPDSPRMRQLADRKRVEVMHEIAENMHFPDRTSATVLFRDFAKEYVDEHAVAKKSRQRIEEIVARLVRQFGTRELSDISRRDVERYQAHRLRDVKPASTNREIAILKHMFNKAIEWGKVDGNPAVGVRLFKETPRVRYLSDEDGEVQKLLGACPGWLRPIVGFARATGMRLGEILGLTWGDVDLKSGSATLHETKGGGGRVVLLNATALEVLKALPRGLPRTAVFRGPMGSALQVNWVSKRFRKARQEAGLEDLRFHDLRHDFASRLAMKGAGLQSLMVLLGHKSPAMTQRYSHLSETHLRQTVRLLDENPAEQEAPVEGESRKVGGA